MRSNLVFFIYFNNAIYQLINHVLHGEYHLYTLTSEVHRSIPIPFPRACTAASPSAEGTPAMSRAGGFVIYLSGMGVVYFVPPVVLHLFTVLRYNVHFRIYTQ